MSLHFNPDDASDPRVVDFLQAHLDDMHRASPAQSVHALDVQQLRQPGIRFWTAWLTRPEGPRLVGSCALKQLDGPHLELKTMRVEERYRGSGVAQQVLDFALQAAGAAGARRVSLETGTSDFFVPAQRFYLRNGFVPCAPFGSYLPDPNSCFMTRTLDHASSL